jgi:hypothetical protein
LALLFLVSVAGCTDNGIGRKCIAFVGDAGIPSNAQTLLSSPALECPTRLCLIQTSQGMIDRATCTAQCMTNDDCSMAVAGSASDQLCPSGFVCAVATVTGAFKCKKLCICHDDLVCGVNGDADGGVITPSSCPNPSPVPGC